MQVFVAWIDLIVSLRNLTLSWSRMRTDNILFAARVDQRGVRAGERPGPRHPAGVHHQGGGACHAGPVHQQPRAPQDGPAVLPARGHLGARVRHHPRPPVHGELLLPHEAVRGREHLPQLRQGLHVQRRRLQLQPRHRAGGHAQLQVGRGGAAADPQRSLQGGVRVHQLARALLRDERQPPQRLGALPQDDQQQRVLPPAAAHCQRLLQSK